MRLRSKIIAAGVASLLLLPLGIVPTLGASSAASGTTVREVVVSVLGPDGDVESTRVLQLIRLDGSPSREASVGIGDDDEIDDYRTLSGFGGPSDLGWRASDRFDAVALAEVRKALPLEVDVNYTLDGEQISPAALRGRSGTVRIAITLRNVSAQPDTLTHQAVTQPFQTSSILTHVPLEFSVRTAFDEDWRDLSAEDAYIQTDAHGTQIVVRPGLLSPPLTDDEDSVVFEATSDNVLLPKIQIFAFARQNPIGETALGEQIDGLSGLYGGLGSVGETIGRIYAGTVQIADGVGDLLEGVGERDEDSKEPVITLDDAGDPTTLLGALGFIGDAIRSDVLPGLGERDPDTGEPVITLDSSGAPETLLGALAFLERALTDQILPALGERDPKTGRAVKAVDDKGRALTLLWGLQSTKDAYDEDLIPGMDQLIAAVNELIAGIQTLDAADPGLVEGLQGLAAGMTTLISNLDKVPPEAGSGIREGLEGLKQLALFGQATTTDPNVVPVFAQIAGITDQLLLALGQRNDDGTPQIVLGPDGQPLTVIGAIGFMRAALTTKILPAIGTRDPATGDPVVVLGPDGTPATLLGALGFIRDTALHNPDFTKKQAALGGRTPKAYFQDCPACFDPSSTVFDPATADPKFQPAFRDAFVLFSEGLAGALEDLHTLDPANPGLVDGLQQIADGLDDLTAALHTFDADNPGLVDGLEHIADGLDELAAALHTFDADNPGLVDGLELARNGVQQVSQGLFALNELGVRTIRGQVGDSADQVARDHATLRLQAKGLEDYTFLATGADESFTTFIFEIGGQSTTDRDNVVRGGMAAVGLMALALFARRPRWLHV